MWIVVWIAAVYLVIGVLAAMAVQTLCWLTSEGAQRRLPRAAELKATLSMVLLWPLLLVGAALVAAIFLTWAGVAGGVSDLIGQGGRPPDRERLQPRRVVYSALAVGALCLALTAAAATVVPRAQNMPRLLELWIMYGLVTGLYLSVSHVALRPVLRCTVHQRALDYVDVAHALQLPVVIGGFGTWAAVKAIGLL